MTDDQKLMPMETDPSILKKKLKEFFGFSAFKGDQERIIRHLVAGGNAFVLMPTGGGKSLCYQLPALVMDGTAIVISPLIALMKDIHILLPEITEGFIHGGTQLVGQDADAAYGSEGWQGFGGDQALAFHKDQHPFAFRGVLLHPLAELRRIPVAEDKLRRTENQHGAVIEGDSGFFAFRGEGKHVPGLLIGRGYFGPQGVQRGAVFIKDAQ